MKTTNTPQTQTGPPDLDPTDPDRPDLDWPDQLAEQLDLHWRHQLRPRLEGLSDAEYLWEPVPGCWNVRPRGTGTAPVLGGSGEFTCDFAFPEPVPAPVTTIAWRIAHLVVGVLSMRTAAHFGGPAADYQTWEYAGTADVALGQLDTAYAAWLAGVRSLDRDALRAPCGPAEGEWAEHPMAELVLHINREMIHHGAVVTLLRDLYAHRAETLGTAATDTPITDTSATERTDPLMPAHVAPFDTEQDGLVAYLAQQLDAFRSVAFGLTDEQARATPTASALSVGSLVKHAAGGCRGWTARITAAPEAPPRDVRPFEERVAEHQDEHVMGADETLPELLDRLDAQAEETLRALAGADLDAAVPVPQDAPWYPRDLEAWSVRWVALHLLEELARHAGHADLIREALDGATMYELVAAREGWPESDWLKPWRPPADAG